MPIPVGTRLGPYEIVEPIGAGGMGEVYRAHDSRLNRDVAIKVSSLQFSERFEREARAVAALNHPNICTLYDIGPNYLVMELVEGPTLAERIQAGAVPLEETTRIAKQIADALEAAHEKGIVHRDLKPANVKVKSDGTVKVLDFGLAKHTPSSPPSPTPSPAQPATHPLAQPATQPFAHQNRDREGAEESPTISMAATQAGVILGTAAYMSPEQAAGKPVDKRADIWSFGVVVWEMLTGARIFSGETVSHTLAAVLIKDPDWTKLPASTPSNLRRMLRRCLERDLKRRLMDIASARLELDEAPAPEPAPTQPAPPEPKHRWLWPAVAGVSVLIAAALAFVHFREQPPETPLVKFSITPPEGTNFALASATRAPAVISPDGKRLVFGVISADGKRQLWVRSLDTLAAQPLANTDGATVPFWSPDSRSIGFFADGKLKKIDASGGAAFTLCAAPQGRGGSWSQDGVIVFAPDNNTPLHQVSEAGGASTPVTSLDKANSHRWPWFLPDGRHFLYAEQMTAQGAGDLATIRVASLDANGKDSKIVLKNDFNVIYSQGYLLFLHEGTLMAQAFDLKSLATTAAATPIAEKVEDLGLRIGVYSASRNGLLAYHTGSTIGGAQLAWLDRTGKVIGKLGDPGNLNRVHLSRDGKSATVAIIDRTAGNADIWLYDILRGIKSRFSFDPAEERESVWSPDGLTVVFNSNRKGRFDLYRKASNMAGAEELLYADGIDKYPNSFSPDGKFLLYNTDGDPKTRRDLIVLPLSGDQQGKPFPFLQTPFVEYWGQFAPGDGRWIAYASDESQRMEIYVAPFPGPGGKKQISTAGGDTPIWRRDGKEIFYIAQDNMLMAVEVNIKGPVVDVGTVHKLFGPIPRVTGSAYDVSADGKSFLVRTEPAQSASGEPLTIVQNWAAGLKK